MRPVLVPGSTARPDAPDGSRPARPMRVCAISEAEGVQARATGSQAKAPRNSETMRCRSSDAETRSIGGPAINRRPALPGTTKRASSRESRRVV